MPERHRNPPWKWHFIGGLRILQALIHPTKSQFQFLSCTETFLRVHQLVVLDPIRHGRHDFRVPGHEFFDGGGQWGGALLLRFFCVFCLIELHLCNDCSAFGVGLLQTCRPRAPPSCR